MRTLFLLAPPALLVLLSASTVRAETYQVGPDKPYKGLEELSSSLLPGDIVEVDGDAIYPGDIHIRPDSSGTAEQKVTIRGIPINGKRPVIEGGTEWGIVLHASHFVFEGFEVRGASNFCIVHKADDVTISDVIVHDCPNHGILGTDSESGSLTIQYSEVYGCGNDLLEHQIYIATDESMYPGSVFRLEHSYIHDGTGGNNVKTRAERNEIYCNWIENPVYHVLDLIDPDGQEPTLAREDSDVVGNVLIQNGPWYVARLGGDHDGLGTSGRYRFAFNTIVSSSNASTFFYLMNPIESAAFHNNVFLGSSGAPSAILDQDDAIWTNGSQIAGVNNWVASGVDASLLSGTLTGEPLLADAAGFDFRPTEGSVLLDASAADQGPSGFEVPNGWAIPTCVAAPRRKNTELAALGRPVAGVADVGAFELGTTFEPGTGGGPPGPGEGGNAAGGAGQGGEGSAALDGSDDEGCGCSLVAAPSSPSGPALLVLSALLLGRARRRPGRSVRRRR